MDKNKSRLLLIDGHSIVNRAFYGIPPLSNSEGLHTNAIMGFLNIFLKAYEEFKPDYCLVAFDVRQKTFRHDMYAEYKGTRKPMPDELHEQVPVLKDVLHSMGISTVELPGYEADDVIGTYATKAHNDNNEVVILSGDRDLLQLATDKIMVALAKTSRSGTEIEKYYAAQVQEKYGVSPAGYLEMKALMGDSSDNIPGIPGIGEKTAAKLIAEFGTLENTYAHIDEVKPNKARISLEENIEQGRMSLVLATINTDSPVELDYHISDVSDSSAFYNDESYELFKRLELNRLLERFDMANINSADSIEYVEKSISELKYDPEAMIGFHVAAGAPCLSICDGESTVVYTSDNVDEFKKCVNNLLADIKNGYCSGLKNILHSVGSSEFYSESINDIEILAYLIDPVKNGYSYDSIAKDFTGKIVPSRGDLIGKLSDESAYQEDPDNFKTMMAYCARTAYESAEPLLAKVEEMGMSKLYTDIERPLIYSLFNMELQGVKVEKDALAKFSQQLLVMAEELQADIYQEAGEEFNINSPMQLGNILFEKLKLPHGKKTKKGYSTSADVLEKLKDDFPIVTKILKYRQVIKLRSTYAEGLAAFISEDGRIHGTFNQTVTATGRISSTEPNLQNIPIRNDLGQEIRKSFVAKEGCVFLDADYSQIELRLLAHISDDKNLIEAYYSDADIHKITASKVFNTPLDQVTKEQRRNAKAVNFGIVYGISSFGLSQDLSITRKQANDYIKQYFETYPGVKEYLDNTVRSAKNDGYVTTMFGRRRPIPELSSSNFMQRSFGERAAMNAPIQGSAADIIKIAMINVDRALRKNGLTARIVLQIHDELLVETPEAEVDQVKEILETEMKNAVKLSVPLEVEVEIGKDWFEAH